MSPTGWSLEGGVSFSGTFGDPTETLGLNAAGVFTHSLSGTLTGTTGFSSIFAEGSLVPGAAMQSPEVPLPPALPLLAAGLGALVRVRRRAPRA